MAKSDEIKKRLTNSLEELLKTNTLENITVGDITREAAVSRTAFYRYFTDKYDLMNWVYSYNMEELSKKYRHITCYYRLVYDQTSFMLEKKDFFKSVIRSDGAKLFFNTFSDNMEAFLASNLKKLLNENSLSVKDAYLIRSHTASMYKLVTDWINGGCMESPQYITELIAEIMPEQIRKFFVPTYPDFSDIYEELF